MNAQQAVTAAETAQRQAGFSTSRAESLTRQADLLENRARPQGVPDSLGYWVDKTV